MRHAHIEAAGILYAAGAIPLFASLDIAIVLASGAVCSALVTRRSALELLQTKE